MISIIVPVLNEEQTLAELHRQIRTACDPHGLEFEVIFVDDGSTDSSWHVISELAAEHPQVRGIRFRRNFGKAAALSAAFKAAQGEFIMMMDADLQDDPAEIPAFLEKLQEAPGYDVVNGWKERRLDPWHKVYPSKVFNWMIGRLTGLKLHDHNCGIKLFRREVTEEIRLYGELHRFIPVLANARGFRVTEKPVHHRPREFGYSKYGINRFLRGFLDLLAVSFLTVFGSRPLHMLGGIGLACFAAGFLGMLYLGGLWLCMNVAHVIEPEPIGSRPLLLYSVAALLLGAQALSLGLLAELLVANTRSDHQSYSIAETVGS